MAYGQQIGRNNTDEKQLRQCWRTPPELFNKLHSLFHFTVDACASPDNALLPKYWTEHEDARCQDWSGDVVYCNPPYGNIGSFLVKAPTAKLAVFVLPITALATQYFSAVLPSFIAIPPYRLMFIPPNGMSIKSNPTLGSVFLLYGSITSEQIEGLKEMGLNCLEVK